MLHEEHRSEAGDFDLDIDVTPLDGCTHIKECTVPNFLVPTVINAENIIAFLEIDIDNA
jgi:hypothetical protein